METLNDYRNILIFNPAFLGDTVLTTPLIRLLRKIFPKSKISFCVRPEHEPLFQGIDILDNVISFDKRKKYKGPMGLFSFASYMRSMNFDLVIDLHMSLRSSFLCASLRPARVIGFKSAVLSRLFTDCVERDACLQEAERNISIAAPLCKDFSLAKARKIAGGLTCYIDRELLYKTKHYYAAATGGKKVVGIAPGSIWRTKRYPAEYFAAAAKILNDLGYAIALFGGPGDKSETDEFKRYYNGDCYDFAEKTSLRELPALLDSLDLLIVNDSGAMHVAIAAAVPCVAIFGPTVKALGFFPYDNKSVVVENAHLPCRPCGKHGGEICPLRHFKCMLEIPPSVVAQAAAALLKGGK